MAEQTLEEIVAGAQEFVRSTEQTKQQVTENTKQIVQKIQETADIYRTVASDVAVVTATQQAAQLKMQQRNAQISRAAGYDPEAGADIIVDTVSKLRKSNEEVQANLKEYRRKTETGFFDAPIDYIVNQITLPSTETKLQNSVTESKTLSDQLTTVNNTLQNSFQTTAALKESTSATAAESATRVAAAQALVNSNEASIAALKYNNVGIEAVQNMSREQLQTQYSVLGAQNTQKQMDLAQKRFALDLEEFDWRKKERAAADAAKAEGKQVDESIVEKINLSRASLGLPPVTGTEAKSAVTLLKSGASKDMAYHYENGDRIKALGGVPTVGATPAESIQALSSVPNNLPDIRKETTALLSEALSAVQQNKSIDPKNKKQIEDFINTHVKTSTAQMYSSIVPNSQNLFDVGDVGSYLTLNGIKDLPVVTKVLAPLSQSGQPLNDPKLVLGLMNKAMKDGTLTSSEIAGLATVYQKANLINQQARGFAGFGIVPPGLNGKAPGKNYMARVSPTGKVLDMTDPTAIQSYLSREASKTMGNRVAESRAANPFGGF